MRDVAEVPALGRGILMQLASTLYRHRDACITWGLSRHDDANPSVASDCGDSWPLAAAGHPDFVVPPEIGHHRSNGPSVLGLPDQRAFMLPNEERFLICGIQGKLWVV